MNQPMIRFLASAAALALVSACAAAYQEPEPNWLNPRLNNFRQNVQPDGLFDAPDLVVDALAISADKCPATSLFVDFTVRNDGALSVPAGAAIRIELIGPDEERWILADIATGVRLFPGDEETFSELVELPDDVPDPPYDVRVAVDPDASINECIEDNNALVQASMACE